MSPSAPPLGLALGLALRPALGLALRPWQKTDLGFLLTLRNDVALQALLLSEARGSRKADVIAWLARRAESDTGLFRVIEFTGAPVGYLQAEREDGSGQAATPDRWRLGICLAPAFQGRGLGGAALGLLEAELQSIHTARLLTLQVDAANARALALYRRHGFQETARIERHVQVGGVWRNVVVMTKALGPTPQRERKTETETAT